MAAQKYRNKAGISAGTKPIIMSQQNFLVGNFKGAYPEQTFPTQKGEFSKIIFAIETADKYNPTLVFEAIRSGKTDNIAQVKNFRPGDAVKVYFDLRCRKAGDRWFTSAEAWKIERLQDEKPAASNNADKQNDDLPF